MTRTGYIHIIEDSANAFFAVRAADDPRLAHCYIGIEVKRVGRSFAPKAGSRGHTPRLVRRECTRIVAPAPVTLAAPAQLLCAP